MENIEKRLKHGVYYPVFPLVFKVRKKDEYVLSHHVLDVSAHHEEIYSDLQTLFNRMRGIAPLHKWLDIKDV